MADTVFPGRPTFINLPVQGLGGFMQFSWPEFTDHPGPERLAIRQWELQHIYHTVELYMSGGFGSAQEDRVADHFKFTVAMDLDRQILAQRNPIGPGPVNSPFLDSRLEGAAAAEYKIKIRLHCGDPSFATHPDLQSILREWTFAEVAGEDSGLYYQCDRVSLDEIFKLNSARGDKVVKVIIKGSGSAPLDRYLNGQWCGSGAFGLPKAEGA